MAWLKGFRVLPMSQALVFRGRCLLASHVRLGRKRVQALLLSPGGFGLLKSSLTAKGQRRQDASLHVFQFESGSNLLFERDHKGLDCTGGLLPCRDFV